MKGFPKLTLKRIFKRHQENPQDKELHKVIETKEGNEGLFDKVINEATKHKPFDKKSSS